MRVLKLFNYMSMGTALRRKAKDPALSALRTGTHSKFIPSFGLATLFFVLMGVTSFGFHSGQLQLISEQFAQKKVVLPGLEQAESMRMPDHVTHFFPLPPSPGYALPYDALEVYAVYFGLILLSALFLTLGTSDFRKTEWDLEWLVTLPLSKKLLMSLRILERTVSNPILILAVIPPVILVLILRQWSPVSATLIGIAGSIPLLLLASSVQTVMDTGVRLHWRPARIKNLQAITNLAGAALFYLISLSGTEVSGVVVSIKEFAGRFFALVPTGLLLQAIFSTAYPGLYWLLYLVLALILSFLAFQLLVHLLKNGVVSGSGQATLRGRAIKGSITERLPEFFSAFTVREIRMLIRDHQYLAQTVITPLLILCLQVYFLWKSKGQLFTDSKTAAAVAFGMAGYSLMSSCYMVLVTEGSSLWIWYTFPQKIQNILFQKVARWGWIAAIYILIFFIWCALQSTHAFSFRFVSPFLMALLGIPILVVIATSLGVLGFEGPSATPQRRMKPSSTYIYLFSLAAYIACLFIPTYWLSATALIFMVLVAFAFWQKAQARLPYLLDPASVPAPQASLSDGLIAAQGFFLLQNLFTLIQMNEPAPLSGLILLRAFLLSGLITFGVTHFYFRKRETRNELSFLPENIPKALSRLVGCTLGLFCFNWVYCAVLPHEAGFSDPFISQFLQSSPLSGVTAFALFVAIPVFQEIIFRSLIYRGFRQKFSMKLALPASSLIFALVHPPAAMVPAFMLGLASSWLLERSGSLIPSILLHALFNFSLHFILTQVVSLTG